MKPLFNINKSLSLYPIKCIFGIDDAGRRLRMVLENSYQVCVDFFVEIDEKNIGKVIDGVKVISVDELSEMCEDVAFILTNDKTEIKYEYLLKKKMTNCFLLHIENAMILG